jgi:PAS domain S-box-containing protein
MTGTNQPRRIDEQAALRAIVEGTASHTGEAFFSELARNLALAVDTFGAWVTEYLEPGPRLRALGFWFGGRRIDDYEYEVAGTPCEPVVADRRQVHIPDRILDLYPGQPEDFRKPGVVSYLGVPLLDDDERVLGHLAVVDTRPMPLEERLVALFKIFADRAGAEMWRMRLETDLREREAKLAGLVGSAMDAIIELDADLGVALVNAAAEKVFETSGAELRARPFDTLLEDDSSRKLRRLIASLEAPRPVRSQLWIPGGLTARRPDGHEFPAEATLSRFELRRQPFYTLILRNVNERIEAEREIRSLNEQTEYLREELKATWNFDQIVGERPALVEALREVEQVAPTEASVLLGGETGTGKELFAQAIHNASPRGGKPMIKVNCAAIPASLMESEFFGHERGAFTGATRRREGRFALADGGTVFLDEVGELPLELQGKLLRVLQEGEFEPVGSSRTYRVDVRVLSATNRDLEREVAEGRFREDLYYRLNVFPIRLPPLRERGGDVVLLARGFAERVARRLGRTLEPFSQDDEARLRTYAWPGNVRELHNVIERALITSSGGALNLDRALPETRPEAGAPAEPATPKTDEILTARGLKELERDNLIRALTACDWRIGGEGGAAGLLGMKPSTLKSRVKALGIRRPAKE